MKRAAAVAGLLICVLPQTASAWGERGHHSICFVSSRLVKDSGLSRFLSSKGDVLGHLCNVPDIVWKGRKDKTADATHFVNPDLFSVPLDEIPPSLSDYAKRVAKDAPQSRKQMRMLEKKIARSGTAWWRVEQLFRTARAAARRAATAPKPETKDLQNSAHPYNQAVYDMLIAMGALGHFVGDLAMPFHNTKDYDGRESGHAGIHHFYETEVVNALGLDLDSRVGMRAGQVQVPALASGEDVFRKMIELSKISLADIPKIRAADAIHETKRPAPVEAAKSFDDLIVTELARASRTLASLWDLIYEEGGKPDLSAYRSYRYPFQPDFVELDYLPK